LATPSVLIIGSIWPQEQASAACSRTISLIQACQDAGYQVACSADERETEATTRLRARGVTCTRMAPNDSAFDAYLAGLQPQVVIFDRFTTEEKFAWRVREVCPDSLRVLDTIDLHFLRLARMQAHQVNAAAFTAPMPWSELLLLAGDTALREVAAIYRSDLSLVTSDAELRLLVEEAGVRAELLQLCRLTYPPKVTQRTFAERQDYACIGNFRHPPNVDAVMWLKDAIWPLIRQMHPGGELHIWGAHAKSSHLAWSNPAQGFHVHGYADSPAIALAGCRVNLAPLRFGAGIKGKIADGWWWGAPAVSTWVGAEGMHAKMPFGGIIADTATELAKAAVRLYHEQPLWEAAAAAGSDLMTQLYLDAVTTQPFLSRLQRLLGSQPNSRCPNLTGQILWQQSMRSTEYFSRWIELKRQHGQPSANYATNGPDKEVPDVHHAAKVPASGLVAAAPVANQCPAVSHQIRASQKE